MVCARCARKVAAGAPECPNCMSDPLLDGRYRLARELASDSIGVSYRATRADDGLLVRARACMVRRLDPDHGDRLARLCKLDHPSLPRRLDEFVSGEASLATRWLIDEHITGHTLAEAIAAAPEHRVAVSRVAAMLGDLASLLTYLHRQTPPVVHGAITPTLILLQSGDRPACLLDLGLASGAVHGAGTRGLTDSLGYLAPEQLYADATTASDIWALGAVAVVALSGSAPSILRDTRSAPRWRERTDIDPSFAAILEGMLDTDPSARISAAELAEAVAKLELASKPSAPQHFPWTASKPPRAAHRPPLPNPKALPTAGANASRRTATARPDAPVMRPEELSRELSQAHQVTVALEQQQRSQLALARVLVVLVAAVIAALATYIALTPG